ncbi:restriction endonuclease subunit S [Vibrio cholerae]|uniref:restriction endonuclease subunit S n=1 Tax=Vibrio cholerae TaxID=666 RepID=UPI000E0A808F|nr:restriction endonuclease subunit S [Vibrio cholerae]EGQ7790065.1 restriction endonuclease subunit S [Vibrio cholerae]EJH6266084.1 restriction endonuclease subunit S [Vibrio cholerae]EJL6418768.1 restriction endonuclease subunit S [Vibrio cholerae]EJL6498345.1 restriction endonuclease subunit S [Vibrio cholerae]EJL6675794.1 restriction endonuclease subunit S [Vibrio cholerae]
MNSSKVVVSTIESVANDKYPSDWDIQRFRHVFSFGKGLSITKDNLEDEGVPTVNYGEVHSKYGFELIPSKHALKCVSPDYLKTGKSSLLKFGDFVFADTSEDLQGSGNFTYLNGNEQVFAGYHTVIARLKPKWRESLDVRFLAYLLDSASFRTQVRKRVKGVKVYSITQSILKDTYLQIPPKKQQGKIARFLDEKVSKINEAIAIKQKQIDLLKERKQIIIQQAVTQGLNPDAPMKDSGVDWIGEIPEHWIVKRAKYLLDEINERSETGLEELLSVSHMTGVTPRSEKNVTMFMAEDYTGSKLCHSGDLVINIMWAWMGALGVSDRTGIVSPSYGVFREQREGTFVPKYLEMLLKSTKYVEYYNKVSTGLHSSRLRFYGHMLFDMALGFPPYEEQTQIVEYISRKCSKVDEAITVQAEQVSKLKEYKTTLINSTVTGKIKVTELA